MQNHDWIEQRGGVERAAAAIAPAVRALFAKGGAGRVAFTAQEAVPAAEADALRIGETAGLEDVYAALQMAAQDGARLRAVHVAGVGAFAVSGLTAPASRSARP